MIGKKMLGSDVGGLLRYLYGPGKANEHVNPRVVAGFDPELSRLEPRVGARGARDFRGLVSLLEEPLLAAGVPLKGYEKNTGPVYHLVLRAAPEDPYLSDAEWREIAEDAMHRTGLALRGDDAAVRWTAVRHADDHVHVVATLARQDGRRAWPENDYRRIREACNAAEERLGLRSTAPGDRTSAPPATRAETERATRAGRAEPARDTLRRIVRTAVAGSASEGEFFARLEALGAVVQTRASEFNEGEVTGFAVGLRDVTDKAGKPILFGGGRLAADLTLPKLRARWQPDPVARQQTARPGRDRPRTERELRVTVRAAADGVVSMEEFFGRLEAEGLIVRRRESERNPGQVTGYAVAFPAAASAVDGGAVVSESPVFYSGGRLGPDLTLPKLRARWSAGDSSLGSVGASAGPERADASRGVQDELRRRCRAAGAVAGSVEEYFTALAVDGVIVQAKETDVTAGEGQPMVVGYSVALDAAGGGGRPVFIPAGVLAADLRLGPLQAGWRARAQRDGTPLAGGLGDGTRIQPDRAARAGRTPLSYAQRTQVLEQAAAAAAAAAAHIRANAGGDPKVTADTAWAAADHLTVAARLVEGGRRGSLSKAADEFQRAARVPWGRVPEPSAAGHGLRLASLALTAARQVSSADTAQVLALIAQLAALADSITRLQENQHRAAQAAAGRRAAESIAAEYTRRAAAAAAASSSGTGAPSSAAQPAVSTTPAAAKPRATGLPDPLDPTRVVRTPRHGPDAGGGGRGR